MSKIQFATRVEERQGELFKQTAARLGTTPSDALRMFIAAFNERGGFPYDVRIQNYDAWEPFATEEEAVDFADDLAEELLNE